MTPTAILLIMIAYFGVLFLVSHFSSRKENSSNDAFFKANKNAKWYLVAFGMIGTALSGVTFISVPGQVGSPDVQFKYLQFVLGNAIGFLIIAKLLLPLYYRLNLTSIYGYIEHRLGFFSYKTAASFFLLSRTIGSAARLYLVTIVLQRYLFDAFGVPFWMTVMVSLLLIFAYTYKGGLKTIIITDTLQTTFLVASVVFTIVFVCNSLDLGMLEAFEAVKESQYSKVFFYEDYLHGNFVVKQILGGIFVTLAMVGLDQDLMQKNLSCKNIAEAQKNMYVFTGIFVLVNILFLSVGALLYMYADQNGIGVPLDGQTGTPRTDLLFPEIAFNHFSIVPAVVFLLGITAATFATTDSALTALTTSFCVDFLGMDKRASTNPKRDVLVRKWVHLAFSALMFFAIIVIYMLNNAAVVSLIFRVAAFTYGPLLGLYAFGLFMKNKGVHDKYVPWICLAAPILTYLIVETAPLWLGSYQFAEELIIINGGLTFIGLWLASKPTREPASD